MTKYAFGDSALAAARLSLLADTYAESSARFLRQSIDFRPELAADLGCGPGYLTHLLAATLNPIRTIGFDNSQNFLAQALPTGNQSVKFERHDITVAPFPHRPFDLMFGRFVLTHLRDPESVIESWINQLRPCGILLIEEVESIESSIPAFATYLDMQESMLMEQGNLLYVGPRIGAIAGFANARLKTNQVTYLNVAPSRAANMFHMNLESVREREFFRRSCDQVELDRLDQDLRAIAQCGTCGSTDPAVKWGLRQIALERIPHCVI